MVARSGEDARKRRLRISSHCHFNLLPETVTMMRFFMELLNKESGQSNQSAARKCRLQLETMDERVVP